MEINKTLISGRDTFPVLLKDAECLSEVNEEFSLPDYVPEIRRVLSVRAQSILENKYLNDTGSGVFLELSGTVAYSLMYLDEESSLSFLPLTSTYETKIPLEKAPSEKAVSVFLDNVSYRVLAPRRVSIKSRLKTRAQAVFANDKEGEISPRSSADEIYLERKYEDVKSAEIMSVHLDNVRISDRLDISNDERPLWCDALINITDARCESGQVIVRAEVTVKCLVRGEGESYRVISKSMNLSEEIEAEGAQPKDMARIVGKCVSLSISNEESKESSELFFDLGCELYGEVIRENEVSLLVDAYSTDSRSEETYREEDLSRPLKAGTQSFLVNEEIKSDKVKNKEIIAYFADPVYEKAENKAGKSFFLGKLNIGVILKPTDEDGEIGLESFEIPLKYEVDVEKTSKSTQAGCEFNVGKLNVRAEDSRLFVSADMTASYSIFARETKTVLESCIIKTDEKIKKENACVRVCFPHENETLWDVCKRYHVQVEKIKKQNKLTDTLPKGAIII